MNTKTKISLAAILLGLGVCFYFTPHLAVRGMRSAAEEKNAAKFSGYVDFPAVKENLKASFNAKLASQLGKEKGANPFAAMGDAMAAALINPIVESLVTPESLAIMMEGDKSQPGENNTKSPQSGPGTDTSMSYESFDRFVVTVKQKRETGGAIGLVFNRDGIFSWKLSALRLPI
ncbi:MAG: DUF2939 domain-containing protein [Desulfobulbaceae bacterium]|nr:DUF2939 domain-containing protein [Desulfobulbaceae bacterium]HIJ90856.1 DUF2939 domain-containing protein [Deltaproteobacteria bacterium]